MAQFLFVPVKLDALCLEHGATVVSPYISFDLLPFVNANGEDVHGGTPYVSSDIDAQAFSDQNLFLPRGVHLHWALPPGLAKAVHKTPGESTEDVEFLPAPNRWLVVRSTSPDPDAVNWKITHQWMVESDFISLTPDGTGLANTATPYKTPISAED